MPTTKFWIWIEIERQSVDEETSREEFKTLAPTCTKIGPFTTEEQAEETVSKLRSIADILS